MFIKYCVFPKNVMIFLNSASSAAVLVFDLPLCTQLTPMETEKGQSPEYILKSSNKTLYLMNTLYLSSFSFDRHIILVGRQAPFAISIIFIRECKNWTKLRH